MFYFVAEENAFGEEDNCATSSQYVSSLHHSIENNSGVPLAEINMLGIQGVTIFD